MAESSKIAWTKSTFNPWIGCTKVSPGCDHCYASVSTPARTLGVKWGTGQPRRRTSEANWRQPLRWNAEAARTGAFWPVFCSSLADVFDNEVPTSWRVDLFRLIEQTPHLTWLLLTKRVGNVERLVDAAADVMDEVLLWPLPNVWLGATITNQEEANRDIPKLLAVPAAKRFVSYEPALGPVDWSRHLWQCCGNPIPGNPGNGWTEPPDPPTCCGEPEPCGIGWIIIGGESDQRGMKARPFNLEWARSTVRQCRAAGAAVFFKQGGSHVILDGKRMELRNRSGADPAEWPADLRVQERPR